ncbi:MAG: [protein-PII] uridylyltransferase [Acidimicrobiales bacterium]
MAAPLDRDSLVNDRSMAGVDLCRAYSAMVDEWLVELFDEAGSPRNMALVAVGGFGRRELSPQSDIDLLLLHGGRQDPAEVRTVAEKLWYPIWDQGLKLGHAVRSVKEAMALASDDLETATALLSARLVAGNEAMAAELADKAAALWRKRSKRFLGELSRSVKERHDRAGEVAYLLEPDLKEGRGGLRDVHAIHWAEDAQSVIFEGDEVTLSQAYERLLSARVELHRVTGRAGDRLTLEDQDAVAAALGYEDADVLMRLLAQAARDIAWTSDDTWARVDSSLAGPTTLRVRRDRALAPGVILREGLVHLTLDADPAADPLLVLRTAVAAAQRDTRIDRKSLRRLTAAASPMPFPWTTEARQLFAELLLAGEPAIEVIETLDRKGLWVGLLPEWEPVRCKPQRNALHTYTVDRHLCQTAANAAALADRVDRPDLLVVGALLHDIGKGYPGDHTVVGIDVIERIGERMGYPPEDIAVLQEMVRHHLLLPDVATRRDLDDDGTIRKVADEVGNVRCLRLLHALTIADSMATGPAAWNDWKAGLVDELASRTEHLLGGGTMEEVVTEQFPTDDQLAQLARHELIIHPLDDKLTVVAPDRPGLFSKVAGVLALRGLDVLEAAAYSSDDGMALEVFRVESPFGPSIDWPKVVTDLERSLAGRLALAAHLAERARRYARPSSLARVTPQRPTVRFDNDISESSTVVEVQAPDGIGVLYRITHALADLDLDVRTAKIHTMGTEVVDAFYVRDRSVAKVLDPSYLGEIERAIVHALTEAW